MALWVYEFSGCPDLPDTQHISKNEEREPGHIVLREREGGVGIVDGYLREELDQTTLTVRFAWVASGSPETVTPAVIDAAGIPRP